MAVHIRPEGPGPQIGRALLVMFDQIQPVEVPVVSVSLSEPLLNAEEIGRLLGVPRSTVYEYARRRHNPLPSISLGRHRRFYRSEIETWLAEQRG